MPSKNSNETPSFSDDGPVAGGVEVKEGKVEEERSRHQKTWLWEQVFDCRFLIFLTCLVLEVLPMMQFFCK